MTNSVDGDMLREVRNYITRRQVAESPEVRRENIAMFICSTVLMAQELGQLIGLSLDGKPHVATEDLMLRIENDICREFEKRFGHSMIAEAEQQQKGE